MLFKARNYCLSASSIGSLAIGKSLYLQKRISVLRAIIKNLFPKGKAQPIGHPDTHIHWSWRTLGVVATLHHFWCWRFMVRVWAWKVTTELYCPAFNRSNRKEITGIGKSYLYIMNKFNLYGCWIQHKSMHRPLSVPLCTPSTSPVKKNIYNFQKGSS